MQYIDPITHPSVVIEGLPFIRQEKVWRRLPLRSSSPLPESVESLTWNTAGGQLRFALRGTELGVRVKLRNIPGQMRHMPATGEAAVDCYTSFSGCEPEYLATARVEPGKSDYEDTFFVFPDEKLIDITLNLPLYNGIESLELVIGDRDEILPPLLKRKPGRIVVYGSSIDQGGCAARPGMAYTNILSRWMNIEFVDLGFSGAGKAEAEVAHEIAKIDGVTGFVINTAPNCPDAAWLASHLPGFLSILREKYPDVPMLICQQSRETRHLTHPDEWRSHQEKWEVEEHVVAERKASGDTHISVFRIDYSADFMGHPLAREVFVDGTHPTDLGFMMQAMKLYPVLKDLF